MNLFRKGALSLCALLSLSFAMPQQASAEGFSTYLEGSAHAMGLAGGLVARGGDASVVSYNPAAMTRLEGTQFQANLDITQMFWGVDTGSSHDDHSTNSHSSHQTWPIPSWYLTHQLNDKVWLGIGQFTRFGLGVKYPQNWPGGYNLQSVQLITSSINPNIAYKLNDVFSIAVGAEVLYADMQMRKNLASNGELQAARYGLAQIAGRDVIGDPGDMNLNGHGFAFGGNIALHAQFNEQWSAGLTYRAPMSLKVQGKARWDNAIAAGLGFEPTKTGMALMGALMGDPNAKLPYGTGSLKNKVRGTIHLPDSFAFAVAYKPTEKLSFEAGATYTLWSRFENFNVYMKHPVNHWNNTDKKWKNNWAFNVSGEWWATDWMALRLGFVYDMSPTNYGNADYMMPSNGRSYYTCGLGFKWDKWTLDLGYMYAHNHELNYDEAASSPVGAGKGVRHGRTTHPHAHNFGIGIGYKF